MKNRTQHLPFDYVVVASLIPIRETLLCRSNSHRDGPKFAAVDGLDSVAFDSASSDRMVRPFVDGHRHAVAVDFAYVAAVPNGAYYGDFELHFVRHLVHNLSHFQY